MRICLRLFFWVLLADAAVATGQGSREWYEFPQVAHWRPVALETHVFAAAPAHWTSLSVPEGPVDLAFPCVPERFELKQPEGLAYVYQCEFEARIYSVMVRPLKGLSNAQWKGTESIADLLRAEERSFSDYARHLKHPDPSILAKARLEHGIWRGWRARFETVDRWAEHYTWVERRFMITLSVTGKGDLSARDDGQFFSSQVFTTRQMIE